MTTREEYLLYRTKIVPQCEDCKKIIDENYCSAYINPSGKWENKGRCPLSTNYIVEDGEKKNIEKKRVGQQKTKVKNKK